MKTLLESKFCCICGAPAIACYGKFVHGKALYLPVCKQHILSPEQKGSLLKISFKNKTDDEVMAIILGIIKFANSGGLQCQN